MQSHTYKFGTESFKTLSTAYNRFPFRGCWEFWTIGFIYCITKQYQAKLHVGRKQFSILIRQKREKYLFYNKSHESCEYYQLNELPYHPTLPNTSRSRVAWLQTTKLYSIKTQYSDEKLNYLCIFKDQRNTKNFTPVAESNQNTKLRKMKTQRITVLSMQI